MIPDPTTPDLADIPIQICEIHAPTALGPIDGAGHADPRPTLGQPRLPGMHVVHARHSQAEVLFEICVCGRMPVWICSHRRWSGWAGRRGGGGEWFARQEERQDVVAGPVAGDDALVVWHDAVVGGGAELEEQQRGLPEREDGDAWLEVGEDGCVSTQLHYMWCVFEGRGMVQNGTSKDLGWLSLHHLGPSLTPLPGTY